MIYLISAILFLAVLFFAGLYIIYVMTFKAPSDKDALKQNIPKTDQYSPFREKILTYVDELDKKPFSEVSIKSYDGLTLYARVYDRQSELIEIKFHGYRSHALLDFCGAARSSEERNNSSIIVDQRGHGKSDGNTITFGIKERYDVVSWVNFALKTFGNDKKIILSGVSMGAATILMSSNLDLPKNVIGIVADCPFSSPKDIIMKVAKDRGYPQKLMYPLILLSAKIFAKTDLNSASAVNAVKSTNIPILIIHGDDDRYVPYSMSVEIYNACSSYKEMLTVPGAGHALSYFCNYAEYTKTVSNFIDTCIRKSEEL